MKPGEIKALAEAIDADRVRAAQRMSLSQKFAAGAELFDVVTANMLTGIRIQHPDADETELRRIRGERLAALRRREEAGIYVDAGPVR